MIITRILYGPDGIAVEKEIKELTSTEYMQIQQYEQSIHKMINIDELKDSLISPKTN